MIEQHYIATTPKYNFPHPLQDLQLPQRLIELSIRSMKKTNAKYLKPSPWSVNPQLSQSEHQFENFNSSMFIEQDALTIKPAALKPVRNKTMVVAVDVSTIKIGETNTGVLIAVRGAVVWKHGKHYHYLKLGPFPFHIAEENKQEVFQLFRQFYFDSIPNWHKTSLNILTTAPNHVHLQTRMGSLLEKWLQINVCVTCRHGLILLDGSLTAGSVDTPVSVMSQLLKAAREHDNVVLAFSKMTQLRLWGHRLTDFARKYRAPCLLEICGAPKRAGPLRLLGKVYIAKLSEGNCAFRLDVDEAVPHEQAVQAVQKLLGNDLLVQGYPETLRLAHIFSTFTANEVIGIQHYIANQCGLKIVTRPNMRKLLFGPFGKGPEG